MIIPGWITDNPYVTVIPPSLMDNSLETSRMLLLMQPKPLAVMKDLLHRDVSCNHMLRSLILLHDWEACGRCAWRPCMFMLHSLQSAGRPLGRAHLATCSTNRALATYFATISRMKHKPDAHACCTSGFCDKHCWQQPPFMPYKRTA